MYVVVKLVYVVFLNLLCFEIVNMGVKVVCVYLGLIVMGMNG